MKITPQSLVEKYQKEVSNKVANLDLKIQTSVLLMNFFKKKGYEFYFCPKINGVVKTPDFLARKATKSDVLGEIKQSLPNPGTELYEQKAAKDVEQIESYTQELSSISTPHDTFFAAPALVDEAITYYIEQIDKKPHLKDKVVVLKYFWMKGNSHNRLTISKNYGAFSDADIEEEFRHGKHYMIGEGDLERVQGEYKILYTEERINDTPVEYVMSILWHNVIPEIINSAQIEKIVERIKKGENTIEFSIEELMEILGKLYVLSSGHNEQFNQFGKDMLKEAMAGFEKIKRAQKISDDAHNPRYRITHTKITDGKTLLIDYFIKELNKEEFEKRADIEYKRSVNRPLEEINKENKE